MLRRLFLGWMMLGALAAPGALAAQPVRIAALAAGTLGWELDAIKRHGFDRRHGIDIEVVPVAGKQGADIMLAGGAADVIVTDWIWVSRQRAQGADYTFLPYSRQVGGVLVGQDSSAATLGDLKAKRIGVAGGPTDKSWVLLQAFARQAFNLDLAREAEPVFAAAPLLNEELMSGGIDAVITFWQFSAKLKARGAREIVSVAEAARALGLDETTPLLGYVYKESWATAHPGAARALAAASAEAKALLALDDAEWQRLRPLMNAANEAEFEALKAGFRAGIPDGRPVDPKAAAALFAVLAGIGGKELTGDSPTLSPGTFAQPD